MTGLTSLSDQLTSKRLELLRDTVPGLTTVGALWSGSGASQGRQLAEARRVAPALGLSIVPIVVPSPEDISSALAAANGIQAILMLSNIIGDTDDMSRIAQHALEAGWASMAENRTWPGAGGLLSYGPDTGMMIGRAAVYVDKVLKGARPADLPIEQPAQLQLAINVTTARTLGLTIPGAVMSQATELIR